MGCFIDFLKIVNIWSEITHHYFNSDEVKAFLL